ncbi:MAG: M20/M25/M40 family metallo-hydrolase, partial [Clostridia bacterium]|nr:M20/M25/M40 family metallo-hydrolase [Clostridia bacterium]
REQYRNMARVIRENMHLIDNALEVMRELGIEGRTEPIRGGTDGARLSYMGLPCPNLGDGDYAAHGPYEHVVVEEMEQGVEIIKGLVRRYAGAC